MICSNPYHHSANGLIERQFRTIRDYINASLKDKTRKNWANLLPEIEFFLNSTVQKTLGISPAEVIFGMKINRTQWFENNIGIDRESVISEIQKKQDMILGKQDKSLNLTDRTFCLGEQVLVKKEIRNKDEARYEGPYTIIEKIHERSYRMRNTDGRVLVRNVV